MIELIKNSHIHHISKIQSTEALIHYMASMHKSGLKAEDVTVNIIHALFIKAAELDPEVQSDMWKRYRDKNE